MTSTVPSLYDLLDTYAAEVQSFLETNAAKFEGK
jgi:hypothetical protein